MRAFTATLGTETDTASPIPTGWRAFQDTMLWRPGSHPDQPTEATGALWACRRRRRESSWDVVEGTCAYAMPGGPVPQPVYEALRDEILAQLSAAMPVDIVALGLHGAMVADGTSDCEGDLLSRVRSLVGPDVAVGALLDCHAHLTAQMSEAADVLVFFKEYPHTDYVERGEELVDILERTRRGSVRPVMRMFDCRMIAALPTRQQPMRGFVDRIRALEQGPVLSISVVHGFPLGDVPEMRAKMLVVTDNDPALAQSLAAELGHELFAMREQFRSVRQPMAEALDEALTMPGRPIILLDADDNPGAGAPGDSTVVLQLLLERGIGDACMGPFWDPLAVRFCMEAGVGARIALRIGGKVGPDSGNPLDVHCEVTAVAPHHFQRVGGFDAPLGDCAAVRFNGIDVVLTSIRDQAYDPSLFSGLMIDCTARRFIVLKSSQQYKLGFDAITDRAVRLRRPPRGDRLQHVRRPLWPLDPETTLQ